MYLVLSVCTVSMSCARSTYGTIRGLISPFLSMVRPSEAFMYECTDLTVLHVYKRSWGSRGVSYWTANCCALITLPSTRDVCLQTFTASNIQQSSIALASTARVYMLVLLLHTQSSTACTTHHTSHASLDRHALFCHHADVHCPPHLYGATDFGDNVEDEWLIVFVCVELTRRIQGLVIK